VLHSSLDSVIVLSWSPKDWLLFFWWFDGQSTIFELLDDWFKFCAWTIECLVRYRLLDNKFVLPLLINDRWTFWTWTGEPPVRSRSVDSRFDLVLLLEFGFVFVTWTDESLMFFTDVDNCSCYYNTIFLVRSFVNITDYIRATFAYWYGSPCICLLRMPFTEL
jgi:hypothetical protein